VDTITIAQTMERDIARLKSARPLLTSRIERAEHILVTQLSTANGSRPVKVRIHADGSTDPTARGTHTLYPALRRGWTDDVYAESKRAARVVQASIRPALGFPDRGLQERSDFTGFNWADVPVILVELGFMTNPTEDRLLATPAYQRRAALGLCRGTLRYLGRSPGACG